MLRQITKHPLFSLTLTALVCGLLWRTEHEYQGWIGLTWLGYFHFAVPIAYGLFLFWANQFIQASWNKRLLMNIAAIIYGVLVYYSLVASLTYIFNQGPSGFLMLIDTPPWKYNLFRYSIFVIIPLIPFSTFLILKIFKIKVSPKSLILSIVSIIISIPLSTILLKVVNHKGGHDYIHSIKSGFLIPLLVFSIGLLFIGHEKPSQTRN